MAGLGKKGLRKRDGQIGPCHCYIVDNVETQNKDSQSLLQTVEADQGDTLKPDSTWVYIYIYTIDLIL